MVQVTQFTVGPNATLLLSPNPRRVALLFYTYSGGSFFIGPQSSLLVNAAIFPIGPLKPLALLLRHYGNLIGGDWWIGPGVPSFGNVTEVILD